MTDLESFQKNQMAQKPPQDSLDSLVIYSKSPTFTQSTVREILTKNHGLSSGKWGRINFLKGSLMLHSPEARQCLNLNEGETAVIQPQQTHWVTPGNSVEFFIEFLRERT